MSASTIPHREIRAHYTEDTVIVYQAYSTEIGASAVRHQRLDASPKFSTTRMTWIKPSWAWMLYRSDYSYKDPGQECILALSVKKAVFIELLTTAIVTPAIMTIKLATGKVESLSRVRVQWDPERTVRLEKLPHRSIQVGVPGAHVENLIEGICLIEDVTERARELKRQLDESPEVDVVDLRARGLVPDEKPLTISEELRRVLKMEEQ
ncbi:hypothetical protein E8E12_006024 [Didymella heteroderae]|uniref:Pterin-binding domain-containing protein n=1 Tax=Didymella heteroderae TaxID=1769908 RepID=A0A9P5BZ63_9PLEO|nr:hypothetical protein E8E12_006024 [Didymella heteroderae]